MMYNLFGDYMVIYIDVLIFLNAVIDFCLLNLAALVVGHKLKNLRLVMGSLFAALFSLLIFIPPINIFFKIMLLITSSSLTSFIAFGIRKIKLFLKFYLSFLAVSVSFEGIVTVFLMILKPNGMILKNSVLYLNISPLEMIFWTIVSYIIIRCVLLFVRRASPLASRCKVTVINGEKTVELTALVDTGNSLKDIYTGKHVIIVDADTANEVLGNLNELSPVLLPYSTVSGTALISAYRCNNTKVNNQNVGATLIAVSDKISYDYDYKAIVNPQILNEGERL